MKKLKVFAAALAVLLMISVPATGADKLDGDAQDHARDRLKIIKKAWDDASKAERLSKLEELARYPERKVGGFLEDIFTDEDEDDLVAERAAWALVRHDDPEDADDIQKAIKRAKTPERKAALVRWLGKYGEAAPFKDLSKIALSENDLSAEAAARALADIDSEAAWDGLAVIAQSAKFPGARTMAISLLLGKGDKRGIETLENAANLEGAAAAAHFAIGTEFETDAIKKVLEFARKGGAPSGGKRPHMFGSLLARMTRSESHAAVVSAMNSMSNAFDAELGWWMISANKAGADWGGMGVKWLKDDDKDDILNGLRFYQRLPEVLSKDKLGAADEKLTPLLDHEDDDIAAHAMFTCASTGACEKRLKDKVAEWIKDDVAFRRAAALLTAARADMKKHGLRSIELLKDESWFVRSAAMEAILYLRPEGAAVPVYTLAESEDEGRLFSEAIALLGDLTGQDHGDLLDKWLEWLKANEKPAYQKRKLDSLRGIPHDKRRQKTAATFYGLEINSINVDFALDRSVSMVNPVTREPSRRDFADRKADILKRRPEVGRMVRDGFLPRFHVAAAELSAALDGMSQKATIGITLFNHERITHDRVTNTLDNRRQVVNWMLSTDIQGGTDIKEALLEIIEKGEADTILLLSDGEPMSLSILEMIARANAVKRVNILAVSIHKDMFNRHYLDALATRHYGKAVDAEPSD